MKLTVHGLKSRQTIDKQLVELKLTPARSGASCPIFVAKPYVRKHLNVANEVNDVESLQVQYRHLEPIPLKEVSRGDVEKILGQDMFHCIRPLEYFETDQKNTPRVVRLPLGYVLSGASPSTSGPILTCFEAVTQRETESELADPIRSRYDIEFHGT